jgi:hypothetical protein
MSAKGMKIKKDLLRAACLMAPTMAIQRAFVDIVRESEDSGDTEEETARLLVEAIRDGVSDNRWPAEDPTVHNSRPAQ